MTAQVRKWFYLISAVISSIVPILVSLHAISGENGASWLALLAAIGGLFGAGGAGTAAVVVSKQQKTGVFNDPVAAVQQVINQANAAQDDLAKVRDVISQLPTVGPLTEAVIKAVTP